MVEFTINLNIGTRINYDFVFLNLSDSFFCFLDTEND